MNRSSALIGTAAAAALLVTGSVAAMAAINTATSSGPTIEKVSVVADQPGGLAPIVIAPLPEIVPVTSASLVVADVAETTSAAPGAIPSAQSSKEPAKPQIQTSATPMSQEARSISSDRASEIVIGQIDGAAQVTDVSRVEHGGYDSWAVTVAKTDGSRLVGYVFTGATGADVFDWKVLKSPTPVVVTVPAPAAVTSSSTSPRPARSEQESHEPEHSGNSRGSDHDDD